MEPVMSNKVHSEWYWSEQSAKAAGRRIEAKGYKCSTPLCHACGWFARLAA